MADYKLPSSRVSQPGALETFFGGLLSHEQKPSLKMFLQSSLLVFWNKNEEIRDSLGRRVGSHCLLF